VLSGCSLLARNRTQYKRERVRLSSHRPPCPLWLSLSAALAEPQKSCDDLSVKILIVVLGRLLAMPVIANVCPKNQPKTEAALLELEQNWAQALTETLVGEASR